MCWAGRLGIGVLQGRGERRAGLAGLPGSTTRLTLLVFMLCMLIAVPVHELIAVYYYGS